MEKPILVDFYSTVGHVNGEVINTSRIRGV